jgi:hypothetical protein
VEDDKTKKLASQANDILACNEECEQALYDAMKLPDDSTSRGRHALANAELKNFAILTKKLLKAFIHVRETDKLKYAGSFPQNKGKLKEAEDGNDNMIRRAFENRSGVLKLQFVALVGEPSAVATDEATDESTDEAIVPLILRSTLGVNHYQPSDCGFLTPGWISSIMSGTIVTGTSLSETAHVWNDLQQFKEKASLLATAIAGRLPSHLHDRVKDKKQHGHFCWKWVRQNLERVSAIMLLQQHVAYDDLDYMDLHDNELCLLSQPNPQTHLSALNDATKDLEGCYLYYNKARATFVRSGKVVGATRSFGKRHAEHATSSLMQQEGSFGSKFYRSYASKNATKVPRDIRRGCFERLDCLVGFGFSRTADKARSLIAIEGEDNTFVWDSACINGLQQLNFQAGTPLEDKQLHMIGYLAELCYDLALAPKDNVSESPGFETPLGIFGGQG